MKGSDYFKKLDKSITETAMNKAVLSAAITVNSEVGERIFQKGLDSEGGVIGKYDTKTPLYVNPNNSPKNFPVKGKNGDKKFQDGSNHKTAYFDSYSAFRKKIGRATSKVNLVLSGILQSDFVKGPQKTDTGCSITLSEENNNKRLGMEEKYDKKIFSLSESERQLYVDLVVEQSIKPFNVK